MATREIALTEKAESTNADTAVQAGTAQEGGSPNNESGDPKPGEGGNEEASKNVKKKDVIACVNHV